MLIELDPLEGHTGIVSGRRRTPLPAVPPMSGTPADVLEAIALEALAEPPCHVLFSGGLDSSLVLAATVTAARRHGLPDPVPLTAVYPDHPDTREDEWQRMVIDRYGLGEWRKVDNTAGADLLGDIAVAALRRHGHYWPSLGYPMSGYAAEAGGGTLMSGSGGDELFATWPFRRPRASELRAVRPRRNLLKWSAYGALPLAARRSVVRSRTRLTLSWLTPEGARRLDARRRADESGARTFAAEVEHYLGSRYHECITLLLRTLASEHGARLVEPLNDPRFVRAVARAAPRSGFARRSEAIATLFGHLLPAALIERRTKASFGGPVWGPRARAFAEAWDGTGVDPALVDRERLRAAWLGERPDARAATALHLAWLSANPPGPAGPR